MVGNIDKTLADLQKMVCDQQARIDALEKDQGIEGAIKKVGVQIVAALGPTHSYGDGEADAIGELRSSLARPNFNALERNVGRTPFPTNQSGTAS
jgi:hypothetical protein